MLLALWGSHILAVSDSICANTKAKPREGLGAWQSGRIWVRVRVWREEKQGEEGYCSMGHGGCDWCLVPLPAGQALPILISYGGQIAPVHADSFLS